VVAEVAVGQPEPKTHSLHLKIPLYTSKQSKKMVWPIIGAEGYVGETGQVNETEK
jgi:hypothetical protein